MSQVFENCEVDVQLLQASVIDKQQPYWTWGDNVENIEEIVELFGDDVVERTSISDEHLDDEVHGTATLPLSSKGKLSSIELRSFKRELAKVANENRALRRRVHDLEEMAQKESFKHDKECQKNKKAVDDLSRTLASMEHYFKMEIEELKTRYSGLNEHREGHDEVSCPDMNERGDNDMLPVPENIMPTTE
ncbi:hypothetical protein ACE6H2_022828 [Prunus campanulata]